TCSWILLPTSRCPSLTCGPSPTAVSPGPVLTYSTRSTRANSDRPGTPTTPLLAGSRDLSWLETPLQHACPNQRNQLTTSARSWDSALRTVVTHEPGKTLCATCGR